MTKHLLMLIKLIKEKILRILLKDSMNYAFFDYFYIIFIMKKIV